ncbi:MAG TPA: PSD1 and planctomycete cytochrome C domain-containing protein [Planctomycetota bacterium]
MTRASLIVLLLVPAPQEAARPVDFDRQILPILSDTCFTCHGPDAGRRKADLRLDDEKAAKTPNADGVAAIVPGHSAKSSVYQRLIHPDADEVMPPAKANKKLSAEQIDLLKRWIDAGAKWGEHWAFRPLLKPEGDSIDHFVKARLAREGLRMSPEADRATLLRRVTLDLTGLPPEGDAGEPYEKAVDRLLASPRYGERMAWDWMEISRYADSNGYQGDGERSMWPWRDWVVKAFNENLPYDQFTIWQLAGDLLPEPTREQKLATGFCRNHPINGEGGRIAEENRVDYVMDMAETAGTVWLGLTFNCCRCHDHKFDPLTKKDYYSLFAYFNQTPVNGGGGDPQQAPNLELASPEQLEKIAKLDAEVAAAVEDAKEVESCVHLAGHEKLKTPPEKRDRAKWEEVYKAFEKDGPGVAHYAKKARDLHDARSAAKKAIVRVMVMEDLKAPRKTYLLDKGLYDKRQEEIGPATPGRLPPADGPPNRLGLARWLVSKDNPLTARVTVNRIWQMFFGIGLSKTSENFGVQGEFPVHKELLDWLAADFRENWDVKRLVRRIVTSAAYRQSSRVPPGHAERDPENRLLARGPRFRMPSWMIRDQALAAAGLLVDTPGGPPVQTYQPAGIWEEATFGTKRYKQDKGDALWRRGLYVFWRRIIGPTMFFDTQSRSYCVVKPTRTNTPLHALATLNDVTYVEAARKLAERADLDAVFSRVLARRPAPDERKLLLAGLDRLRREYAAAPDDAKKLLKVGESKRNEALDPVEHAAWTSLCLTILNLDEAVTRE